MTKDDNDYSELIKKLPKAAELVQPLLSVLRSLGGSATNEQIVEAVAKYLALPKELSSIPHVSETRNDRRTELGYRLAWVQTNLKRQGILTQPQKATWKIASQDDQKTIILEWFNLRYGKPHSLLSGGNYDLGFTIRPLEAISKEFGGKFDSEIIEKVSSELLALSSEWIPLKDSEQYRPSEKSTFDVFNIAIRDIKDMAGVEIPGKQQPYMRMDLMPP